MFYDFLHNIFGHTCAIRNVIARMFKCREMHVMNKGEVQ